MSKLVDQLQHAFRNITFHEGQLLSAYTTVKIGGPAEVFCEVTTQDEFIQIISYCQKENIPLTVLGWGANTLIADRGIAGLVIKYVTQQVLVNIDQTPSASGVEVEARWQNGEDEQFPHFSELNYSEEDQPKIEVEMQAGAPLSFAINYLLQQGVTGLQWFSRIPATIGGAIFNNIHGGTHFISEYILSVDVVNEEGKRVTYTADQLEFGYDYSRFHHTNEIIISAKFSLYKGDVEKAKQVVSAWAVQKKQQPQNSLGCVFQNISVEDQKRLQYPTPSVGYIIDKVLNKKGFRIGDAQISEKHAAFIENKGSATAQDYLEIIKVIVTEVKEKTGLTIRPEIFFKGFTQEELSFLA